MRFTKLAMLAISLIAPTILCAQEIRGTVLGADNTPAGGIVMVLLHETIDDSIVARAITNERGDFALRAPSYSTVRLRALRIGFVPTDVGIYLLTPDPLVNLHVKLSASVTQRTVITIADKRRCDVRPDGAQMVA